MNGGLQTTFDWLAGTGNEAAASLLIPALDSPRREIRDGALKALLARRCREGQRELIRRWHTLSDEWKALIATRPGRVSSAVRDAILSPDTALCANGCNAVLALREFDLLPALINAAEDDSNPHAELSARTLLRLADLLYEEVAGPRDYANRRDPQLLRQHVLGSLELSVNRFGKHRRRQMVEAFLVLAGRDNTTLKRILQDPHHPAYLVMVDILTHGERPGMMRLALSFLDDPQAPLTAVNVLSHRGDEPFLRHLLAKVGCEPSQIAKVNIKRMDSIPWLRDNLPTVDQFDDAAQHAAVQLALCSSMNRLQVYRLIERLLTQGTPGGRRAASAALAQFRGNDANQLALQCLADPDPQVQANVLVQLRERGIHGAMTRLIEAAESPHALVRKAAQQCLAEFSFKRFVAAFDLLDAEVRISTGALVKRVDPNSVDGLRQELSALGRSRRMRGIAMAVAMGVVAELETEIIALLADEDHFVRVEAAEALAKCDTEPSREALRAALLDRSVTVQEAAGNSLRELTGEDAPLPVRQSESPIAPISQSPLAEQTRTRFDNQIEPTITQGTQP